MTLLSSLYTHFIKIYRFTHAPCLATLKHNRQYRIRHSYLYHYTSLGFSFTHLAFLIAAIRLDFTACPLNGTSQTRLEEIQLISHSAYDSADGNILRTWSGTGFQVAPLTTTHLKASELIWNYFQTAQMCFALFLLYRKNLMLEDKVWAYVVIS